MSAAAIKPALAARSPAPAKQRSAGSQFTVLANVLYAASMTDEADEYSGNATRLLDVARQHAEEASMRMALTKDDAQRFAFDLAALVSASRRVPSDDKPTVERTELIAQAGNILDRLTGVAQCLDADNARPAAPDATAADITENVAVTPIARREATEEPDAWSPCAYALLVTLAMAERENDPLTWAFHRVIEAAKEAIEALDQQPEDPDRLGVAQDVVREAQTMAVFLRRNRDRDMDGAAELLLKLSAQALEAQIAGQA